MVCVFVKRSDFQRYDSFCPSLHWKLNRLKMWFTYWETNKLAVFIYERPIFCVHNQLATTLSFFLPCGTNLIAIMMMQLKIFMENMLNNLHENSHCLLNRFNKNIKQTEKKPNENGGKKFIFMTISGKYYGSNVV